MGKCCAGHQEPPLGLCICCSLCPYSSSSFLPPYSSGGIVFIVPPWRTLLTFFWQAFSSVARGPNKHLQDHANQSGKAAGPGYPFLSFFFLSCRAPVLCWQKANSHFSRTKVPPPSSVYSSISQLLWCKSHLT